MSDHPPYPSNADNPYGGSAAGDAAAASGVRPKSVDLAVKLIWANIALSLISAVITFATLDSIINAQLDSAGVTSDQINADAVRSAAVTGAIVGLVISVALYALMAIFIGKGANWARIVYTVLAVLAILGSVFGLGAQPPLLLIISVISLLLTIGAVVMLYRSDANAWFKARKG